MKYPSLLDHYTVEKTVGCGGFAKVKLATHVLTGEKVAIKIMQKQMLMEDLPRVKQEIEALKSLSHPNICKLYEVIETETHYFLVLEYCAGGELFDHIVEKQRLSENEARRFFRQIVSAVSYLHSQGYAHRDLKPENILLDKKQNLKLIDFGLCVKPRNGLGSFLHTSCGSPNYAAPELIKGEEYFGSQTDIWSLGVLLYALLCGTLPFDDICIQKLYEKILSGYYEEKDWLSPESKSLIRVLLQINARKRISTNDLRFHPWLIKGFKSGVEIGHLDKKLEKDEQCLKLLSNYLDRSPEDLWNELLQRKYDYTMASYMLILQRKHNNAPIRLLRRQFGAKVMTSDDSCEKVNVKTKTPVVAEQDGQLKANETYLILRDREIPARRSVRNDENRLSGRKACKRIRSPGIEDKIEHEAKKVKTNKTPIPKRRGDSKTTTPSSARKVLEGIEKGLNLAMSALTPRRSMTGNPLPTVLGGKDLCNVTSTSSNSPEEVLTQLRAALMSKGIVCTRKGFALRGKIRPEPNEQKGVKNGACSFELEVCWLPNPLSTRKINGESSSQKELDTKTNAVVGIRRKRLKGDAWIYKNICEEVLAVAAPQSLKRGNK